MAKVIVVNDIDPRELGMVLDKVLSENNCPLARGIGGMIKVDVSSGSGNFSDFLKGLGINVEPPKQNPTDPKNNKGGKS